MNTLYTGQTLSAYVSTTVTCFGGFNTCLEQILKDSLVLHNACNYYYYSYIYCVTICSDIQIKTCKHIPQFQYIIHEGDMRMLLQHLVHQLLSVDILLQSHSVKDKHSHIIMYYCCLYSNSLWNLQW